jgi:predicted deacetylase
MIRIAFRFDDPSQTSNRELEQHVIEIVAKNGLKATVAVIPFRPVNDVLQPLSRERGAHLIEAKARGYIEVALHGFAHERGGTQANGKPAEFVGVGAAQQQQWIKQGLMQLEQTFGRGITGFVPPWNAFDCITLQAVAASGLRYVSAGWDAPVDCQWHVVMLPRTCNLGRLEHAISEARKLGKAAPIIIVVIHHFDFAESGSEGAITSYEEFDTKLSWLARQPDVSVQTVGELAASLRPSESARGFRHRRLQDRLPWRLHARAPEFSFIPTSLWTFWWLGALLAAPASDPR